ncbi:MAG: hypothetical protein AAF191_17415, partial [Verrucomicrobiota bacterium]
LANHYFDALLHRPAYEPLVPLLWDLYERNGETELLISYLAKAAGEDSGGIPKVLYGHLLLHQGQEEEAYQAYEEASHSLPEHPFPHLAMAEIDERQEKLAEALTHLQFAADRLAPGDPDWDKIQSRIGDLHIRLGQPTAAAAVWESVLLQTNPTPNRRLQIARSLLSSGKKERAENVLTPLTKDESDPALQLEATQLLGKVWEKHGEFSRAAELYSSIYQKLEPGHFLSQEFLDRLVRVHQAADTLPSWLASLEEEGAEDPPSSHTIRSLIRVHQQLANREDHERWLRRFHASFPQEEPELRALIELLLEDRRSAEAEELLTPYLATLETTPFRLALLHAEVLIGLQSARSAEEALRQSVPLEDLPLLDRDRLLRFASEHDLDDLFVSLLELEKRSPSGRAATPPAFRLARHYFQQGRLEDCRAELIAFVEDEDSPLDEDLRRALAASQAFRLEQSDLAEAWALQGETRDSFLLLAELAAEREDIRQAIEHYRAAWIASTTLEERIATDERLLTLLRAQGKDGFATPGLRSSEEANASWEELNEVFERILAKANSPPRNPVHRHRAAWWAVQLTNHEEAYRLLADLHDPESPTLAYEELLLQLAEQTENEPLVIRQLKLLATHQPELEEEALVREAQRRLALNFEDEAIRTLRALVARPGATLRSVQALADAYHVMGRKNALEKLWKTTFDQANAVEKRAILRPYTEALLEAGKVEVALEIREKLILQTEDEAERRRLFQEQLSLSRREHQVASWLLPHYQSLTERFPLDPLLHEFLAEVHRVLQQPGSAFSALETAFHLADGSRDLLRPLAAAAEEAGKPSEVIRYLRTILFGSLDDPDPNDWLRLIAAHEACLEYSEADTLRAQMETR